MNQTVNIDVKVDHRSINQLEDELSKVNQELKNISTSDPKFDEYAQQAQQLTRELDKANDAAEGFTSEKKFQAADGAIKLMAGSLSGVVGTLGLIGVESEVFGEMEQKAASAIAVAMGIKDVSEGFNQLKTALTGAIPKLAALNATMLLNPAVLIAAGIAAVGVAIYAMTSYTTEAEEELEDLNDEIERLRGNLDGTVESYQALNEKELESLELQKKQLQAKIDRDAKQGVYFKGREEEMRLLDKEIEKRKTNLQTYKESIQATKDYNKEKIDEVENIKDAIALYGDEEKESGLIGLKLKLLRTELKQTDDYRQRKGLLREIMVLEKEYAKVKAGEDAVVPQEKLETTMMGPVTGSALVDQTIKTADTISQINDKLQTKLRIDAQLTADAVRDAEDQKRNEQLMTLANVEMIAGSETKIGKAMLIARQVLLAKKLVMDVKDYVMSVKMSAGKAGAELVAGKAKAAATLNPLVITGFALQAVMIYRQIKQALQASKVQADVGGGESIPAMPTRRGADVNINPDQVQQLSATNDQTVRAYVVGGDVRSNNEAEAKIQNRRTID